MGNVRGRRAQASGDSVQGRVAIKSTWLLRKFCISVGGAGRRSNQGLRANILTCDPNFPLGIVRGLPYMQRLTELIKGS